MPSTAAYQADFAAARAALPAVLDRLTALIANVPDQSAASPCPPWSVGDVAAHVSLAYLAYSSAAVGEFGEWTETIPDLPAPIARLKQLNTQSLEMVTAQDRENLGAILAERLEALLDASAGRDPAEPCRAPWFGDDVRLPLGTVVGLILSESLLHGLDIARGSGQAWPIDKAPARLVLSLAFPTMMSLMVDAAVAKGLTGTMRIHVRGGIDIGITAVDGSVGVEREPAAARADCHISADPVAFLLTASGRASQNRAIAAGKLVAYGRKPLLAMKCSRLFSFP
jgi:uncharacterized protein (TIGR03083 family)